MSCYLASTSACNWHVKWIRSLAQGRNDLQKHHGLITFAEANTQAHAVKIEHLFVKRERKRVGERKQ
jgi:hypothetical protein